MFQLFIQYRNNSKHLIYSNSKQQKSVLLSEQKNRTKTFQMEMYRWTINIFLKFSSVDHKVDVNKNDIEIPPHSSQIGYWRRK